MKTSETEKKKERTVHTFYERFGDIFVLQYLY